MYTHQITVATVYRVRRGDRKLGELMAEGVNVALPAGACDIDMLDCDFLTAF